MKEIIQRLKSPTPKFWKKVIRLGLYLGGIGGTILLAPVTLEQAGINGVVLPPIIAKAAEILSIAGVVASGLAKLTVDDKAIKEK